MKSLFISFLKLILATLTFCSTVFGQKNIKWDDSSHVDWPKEVNLIEVKSTKDNNLQKTYLYKSTSSSKKPVIISLHTWGGSYAQRDPLLKYCIESDINYLHPDFRGPNNNPKAAGSEYVISDINDIIQWTLDSLNVNPNEIHIVGVSGGAFATVMSYMKTTHQIKSFHAFVGIYNLEDWYYESLARKNNYAEQIKMIVGEINGLPNFDETKKRSPLLLSTPTILRKQSVLHIYAGIHDGYTGSVPISHSLELYNKIVNDFKKKAKKEIIPKDVMYTLLKRRPLKTFKIIPNGFMGRDIIYQKSYKDLVHITIFDGGHEMPEANLLPLLFSK